MIKTDLLRFAKALKEEVPGYQNDWTELQKHLQKNRAHDYQTISLKLDDLKAYYQETYGTELVSDISKALSEAYSVAQAPTTPQRTPKSPRTARSGPLLDPLVSSNVVTPMRRGPSGFANDSVMSTAPEMQSTPVRDTPGRYTPQETQHERYKELYEKQKAAKDELQERFQELQETYIVETRRLKNAEESLREDVGRLEDEVQEVQEKLRKEQENTKKQQTAHATKHTAELEDQLQEALNEQEELRETVKELRTIERKAEKEVRDIREKWYKVETAKQREEEKTKKVQAVLEKKTREHTEKIDQMEANNDLLTQKLEEISEEKTQITQELDKVQHQCEEYKTNAENPINSTINTSTISESAPTENPNPFVGENALIQRTATYKHSSMITEERTSDLILRAEANKDYQVWLNDPILAAIRLFQKKGMTTETMLGLNVGRLAPAAPRTIEEYADHSDPPRNAVLKKDASGHNWPEDFKAVDEKELDILMQTMDEIDGAPRNTPKPEGTTTNAPIAPLPAPFPGESYTETINTDYATLSQLDALLHKPVLEKQDTDFLTTFVLQQSAKPARHILAAIFQLSPRAAAVIRTKKAADFWGDSLPPIHAPTFLSYPLHLLSSIFTSASLDRSDFFALKTSQARAIESALREQIADAATLEAKARQSSSENPDKPQKERTFAPLGMAADILRAGPRPAVAWGLATSALWLVLLYLVVHNVVMYWAMRRELEGTGGGGEVNLGGMGGWGSGCYRVCDDGWAWRAKAMFWEVVEERLWGAEANGGWS